jgi:hypothetical protein
VTREGWLRIPRQQVDEKLMRTLSNSGSSDRLLERKLFGTTPSLALFNTRTFSTRQPSIIAMVMNMNPLMVVILVNVLRIQLPKNHDNNDPVIHIRQLTKVYVINGKYIDDQKTIFSKFS